MPNRPNPAYGPISDDLANARRQNMFLLCSIGFFSFIVNLLMLTGPLYMLQVYDRVLASRSEATLMALSLLVTFLFLMMGLLDYARGRIASRIGARMQEALDERVFRATLSRAILRREAETGLADLEAVQRLLSSPAFLALFDMPWVPFFVLAIFIFHPLLGLVACIGGLVLIVVALLNQSSASGPMRRAASAAIQAERMATRLQSEGDLVRSLGMQSNALARWRRLRRAALGQTIAASDRAGGFTTMGKTLRLFLQSAMLGMGAFLVLRGELTAGAMIAGSILLGRALAPIETAIGQWQLFARAHQGWRQLQQLLTEIRAEPPRLSLPRPTAQLEVSQLSVVPPGASQAALRGVTFRVEPGQAVGVIGPSGAGKSTLAKALTGIWQPAAGQIRLDGATLDQYDLDNLGQLIGYLPQTVTLFDGTIADNIARLAPHPVDGEVVAAARKAAADTIIRQQPQGYDTPIGAGGLRLSGGQLQRVGLARAIYGDPVFLVLDEPNSNLDIEGSEALNQVIRRMKAAGKSVLIMAHRPAAIKECDMLLVLDGGTQRAFGPRDAVLREVLHNAEMVLASQGDPAQAGGIR